ncbi:MAG: glycosyltransferase [Agarilytica sp.]
MSQQRLAIIASSLIEPGVKFRGVKRAVNNLVFGLLDMGVQVDLLNLRTKEEEVQNPHEGLRVFRFKTRTKKESIDAVKKYLDQESTKVVFVARGHRENMIASRLRFDKKYDDVNIYISIRNAEHVGFSFFKRLRYLAEIRFLYSKVTKVIAVSDGLRVDTQRVSGLSPDKMATLYNPTIADSLFERAKEKPGHPWLAKEKPERTVPVLLTVGEVSKQKDFLTLVESLAIVKKQKPVRLIILGEGKGEEYTKLLERIEMLGVKDDIDLVGFQDNPFSFMAQCNVFVLSSAWEGTANVLIEAMACGARLVSTDCPSGGPNEVLGEGKYGELVPVAKPEAMAQAIIKQLDSDPSEPASQEGCLRYTVRESVKAYRALLGV